MQKRKVVVFGPGPQFKGGMANYTTSLAKALDRLPGVEVHLISWTQQYPAIIPRDFIDRASREDKLAGSQVKVSYLTNYNNPLTWRETVHEIKAINPDVVVIQWSIAVQGLPLGYIARRLQQETGIEVMFDLHFVIQKEQSALDRWFTRRALRHADSYIVHAYKTADELATLIPENKYALTESGDRSRSEAKTVLKLFHPVYDMFRPDPQFDREGQKQKMGLRPHVFLFFGFIRKYKGLHHCINAFAELAKTRDDVSLLVVGESFWQTLDDSKWSTKWKKAVFGLAKSLLVRKKDDEQDYRPLALIQKHKLGDKVVLVNDFVPNEDVHKYFQVSDAILLFYEYATPSGVESMAYNFKMPVLASRVGHFPETIKPGVNGYLAEAENTQDMARVMAEFLGKPISGENVEATAREFSWDRYAQAILKDVYKAGRTD